MSILKKTTLSAACIAVALAVFLLMQVLRQVGTTWIDGPGFLRTLVLFALLLSVLASIVFAILVWFGQPKWFYRKLK